MKLVIITPYADPEKGACVVRVNSQARYFEKQGWTVILLAPARGAFTESSEKQKRYKNIPALISLLQTIQTDVVLGVSPPITHNFFALLFCKLKRIPFVLDAKDPFTYILAKLNPAIQKTLKFHLFQWFESFAYQQSNLVVFLNEKYRQQAISRFALADSKTLVASNGTETDIVYYSAAARNKLRKEKNIPSNAPVVIYVGGIGDKDLTGFLEQSVDYSISKLGAYIFFIVSSENIETHTSIINQIQQAGKKYAGRVNLFTNMPYEELFSYLSMADFGLIPYPDFYMDCLGAKAFDYISAGLPVVSKSHSANEELKNFVEKNKIGFFVDSWPKFNIQFNDLINKKIACLSREQILKLAQTKYSRDANNEKLFSHVKALFAPKSN